jgi:hypothetical protein
VDVWRDTPLGSWIVLFSLPSLQVERYLAFSIASGAVSCAVLTLNAQADGWHIMNQGKPATNSERVPEEEALEVRKGG